MTEFDSIRVINDLDFSNCDFPNELSHYEFREIDFSNSDLSNKNLFNDNPPWEIMSGAYLPKYENNKKQTAIITKGIPITLRVASSRSKIPIDPIINSIGIIYSLKVIFKSIPPLSTNWS